MDEPILFNPDNRLLNSAAGDLALYGGQSDARFSVHQARDDASAVVAPGGAGVTDAADPLDSPASIAPAPSGAPVALPDDAGSGAFAPQSFLIAPSAVEFAPVEHVALGETAATVHSDFNPAAPGAGSPVPALDAGEHSEPTAPFALSDGPLMGPAASLLDDLAADPSAFSVGSVADGLLATTTGLAEDTLEGLAGSDPLGGVATLVNLVSVSDTFDLTPVIAPLLETASNTGADALEGLVGEEPLTDALLGSHHDDGGLLGGHGIDLPHGL